MSDINIKTHDFEASKNQIKVFSEQTPLDLKLDKVDTDGWFFGLGDHNVTGHELNNVTTQIQRYLIDFNSLNKFDILNKNAVFNFTAVFFNDFN